MLSWQLTEDLSWRSNLC